MSKKLKRATTKKSELQESLNEAYEQFKFDHEARQKLDSLSKDLLGKIFDTKMNRSKEYEAELRKFSMTLHFYSPKVDIIDVFKSNNNPISWVGVRS